MADRGHRVYCRGSDGICCVESVIEIGLEFGGIGRWHCSMQRKLWTPKCPELHSLKLLSNITLSLKNFSNLRERLELT